MTSSFFHARSVHRSTEFERVLNLPRRDWQADTSADYVAQATQYFKTPQGTMTLWPMQAAALAEAADNKGIALGAGVGSGKTLVSLLLPLALEAERPLLFVPAALRDKTLEHDLPMLSQHWRMHPNLRIHSYDSLSRESGARMLYDLKPDLIIADEAHRLAYPSSARTRRFLRYLADYPDTLFCFMSGTICRKSIMNYWHLLKLALGRGAPLPLAKYEAITWADALDINPRYPIGAGALRELCAKGENPREGYQRRLRDSPGVIITARTSCPASIRINRLLPRVPASVTKALKHLAAAWETPTGEQCTEALELWRHGRELSMGFCYRWIWPPSGVNYGWLDARATWRRFVRETITRGRRGLDTELQVANAARRGDLPSAAYDAWVAVRDEYTPKVEAVWLDDFLIEYVAQYAARHKALVWVEHDAFGRRLAEYSGMSYHGAGATQGQILACRGSTILSAHSHREGKNLQRWHHNIVVSAPPSGASWDQLLGRTHRAGQLADEVVCDVCLHTAPLQDGFVSAIKDATYLRDTLGQEQKLLYADCTFT